MIDTNAKIYEDLKGILVTREEIAKAVDVIYEKMDNYESRTNRKIYC